MPIVVYINTHTHTHTLTHTTHYTHTLTHITHTHNTHSHDTHSHTQTKYTTLSIPPDPVPHTVHGSGDQQVRDVGQAGRHQLWAVLQCWPQSLRSLVPGDGPQPCRLPAARVWSDHPFPWPLLFQHPPHLKDLGIRLPELCCYFPLFWTPEHWRYGQGSGERQYMRDCLFALWHVSHHLCLCMCG